MTVFPFLRSAILLTAFGLALASQAAAQTNFTALEPGDMTEQVDRWTIKNGFEVTGGYRMRLVQLSTDDYPQGREDDSATTEDLVVEHDLRLFFKSIAHQTVSLNLEIETVSGPVNDADLRSENADGRLEADSQVTGIQARQAYLLYQSNPYNFTRLGKVYLDLGDRRGKVFRGVLTGISHKCTAGTWCYEAGAFKTGSHPSDWMYQGSVEYTFYEVKNDQGKVAESWSAEVFRIFYTERDIPLGSNLVPTARSSREDLLDDLANYPLRLRQALDRNGNPITYDSKRQEYFGFSTAWHTPAVELDFDFTSNQGRRSYRLDREVKDVGIELGESSNEEFRNNNRNDETVAGLAMEMSFVYIYGSHRFGAMGMFASGTEQEADPDNTGENFLQQLDGYYELVPGSYRGTSFYFNGGDDDFTGGHGLGHSVNNTMVLGASYRYTGSENPFHIQTGVYSLRRVKEVLDFEGETTDDIGVEWDNEVAFTLDKHISLSGQVNLLRSGKAFAFNDNEVPEEKETTMFQGLFRINYAF